MDGNNPKQLTNSPLRGIPWIFRQTVNGSYTPSGAGEGIWKVPIEGGDPVRLIDAEAEPTISPDGR